ncbi:putative membrane protein [Campylobacter lari]|uniref:hypothetical protein n=1 Tax=Campylobacter lari TaxID=201 RepID=UPI002152B265|nr:hypothetical protein [Campylobacter lari]MCR6512727.1 hypothetical protein [Campylobacter lari]
MSNEIRLENIKRLQKIANEINLIYQQIKDENVLKTLHDENAQRFIFVSLIKISESFKKIKESADDEILSLFDKKDLKRINDTRNFAAHDNEEIRLSAVANVIKYDLFRVKRSINIYMGKLENQKQEVEIMENVVRKNAKSKIAFVVLFGLILINIGILFISKNEIFTKTLIGLIAITFILHYVLSWINTIKSIKDNKYIKPTFKDILFSILKSPYCIIRFFLIGRIKYLGNQTEDTVELKNNKHMYDPSFLNAEGIGELYTKNKKGEKVFFN